MMIQKHVFITILGNDTVPASDQECNDMLMESVNTIARGFVNLYNPKKKHWKKWKRVTLMLSELSRAEFDTMATDDKNSHYAYIEPRLIDKWSKDAGHKAKNVRELLEISVGTIINHMTDPNESMYFDYNRLPKIKSMIMMVD